MAAKKHQRTGANITLRHGHRTHRDAIWAAIRALRTFTIDTVEEQVNGERVKGSARSTTLVSRDTVRDYIKGLAKAGYLQQLEPLPPKVTGRQRANQWELARDIGLHAPRINKHGLTVTQGMGRENLWKTMKILKNFTWRELLAHASTPQVPIKESEARDYIKHLHKAGYLKCTEESRPGIPARYLLVPARYTGPMPPMVQRIKQIYDPNLDQIVWPKENTDERN